MSCITEILKLKGEKPFLAIHRKVVIEGGGHYCGYEYLITFTENGHRCGYVALPPEHPYNQYEGSYSFPVDVHGGVTFCAREHDAKDLLTHSCNDLWIGFDAMHGNDSSCIDTAKKYFGETELFKVLSIEKDFLTSFGTHKTYAYMEKECKNVIRQLIKKAA